MDDYLAKPVRIGELDAALRKATANIVGNGGTEADSQGSLDASGVDRQSLEELTVSVGPRA